MYACNIMSSCSLSSFWTFESYSSFLMVYCVWNDNIGCEMGMVILLSILRYCFEIINPSPHTNYPFYARIIVHFILKKVSGKILQMWIAYSLWKFRTIVEVPGIMLWKWTSLLTILEGHKDRICICLCWSMSSYTFSNLHTGFNI